MAINGIAGDIISLFPNSDDTSAIQGFFNAQELFNTQNIVRATPLNNSYDNNTQATLRNRDMSLTAAQQQADALMALQQKRPVTFEFAQKKENGQIKWRHVQLYINPEKISVSTQKIKGKQVARGGIFYNMYGDDHWQLSISGSTGLSGMRGIEQIEEIYHASGTLLRYENYGPERMNMQGFEDYNSIDYKDPLGIIDGIKNASSSSAIENIKNRLVQTATDSSALNDVTTSAINRQMEENSRAWNRTTDPAERDRLHAENSRLGEQIGARYDSSGNWTQPAVNKSNNVLKQTGDQTVNTKTDAYITKKTKEIEALLARWVSVNKIYDRKAVYDQAIYFFRQSLNNVLESGVQTQLANELTEVAMDKTDSKTKAQQTPDDSKMSTRINKINKQKQQALSSHFAELEKFYVREKRIRDQLKTQALETSEDEFGDVWRPRRILCYFENRVYIGHFDSFNYRRVAQTPLIEYELRFTVEKQIVGDLT